MKQLIARFVREESGQDLIEYAFLAVFIALVVILGLQAVGTAVNSKMSSIASQVSGAS
jgi:Flp pilus assembly pilin Flp